jgi:hypothetical protein
VCGRLTLPHAFNDRSWCVSLQDLFEQPRAQRQQQQQQQQQQPCSDALQLCVIGNYMVDLAWLLQQVQSYHVHPRPSIAPQPPRSHRLL